MKNIKQILALSALSVAAVGVGASTSVAATNAARMQGVLADVSANVSANVSAAQGVAAPAYYTYQNKHYVYKFNGHYYNHRTYKSGHWSYY